MMGQSGVLNLQMPLPDCVKVDPAGGDDSVANEFFMYVFKVQPCPKRGAHDWSSCPYAHPKEKARRRDPRVYKYASTPCPESLKGVSCGRGVGCPYAHSVYEYWLHPSRFRTQMCKKGNQCNRTLCFFAHSANELRFPDTSDDAEAAAVDAAAASATAGALPMVPPTSSAVYATPSSGLMQLTPQSSSTTNSGVLGVLTLGQVCDAAVAQHMSSAGGSVVGHSTGSYGVSAQQDLGFGLGGSEPVMRIPGIAVAAAETSSLSDPLPRLGSDGSNSAAAWLQMAAASQLPASQILSSIRPPPAQRQQQQAAGMMAAGGYSSSAQQLTTAAATSNAALTMQRLSVPGANVMGIITGTNGSMSADNSTDQMAAGLAGLHLQAGSVLVDDSSSSSCITSVSGDHQYLVGMAGGSMTHANGHYDVNACLGQQQTRPSPAKRSSITRMDDLLLLQQNLMRMNSSASSMSGISSSGSGLPAMFGAGLQQCQMQQGSGSWMRIG